jgi:hypothetical protein
VEHWLVIKVLDIPYRNNLYRIFALGKLVIILVSEQAGKLYVESTVIQIEL